MVRLPQRHHHPAVTSGLNFMTCPPSGAIDCSEAVRQTQNQLLELSRRPPRRRRRSLHSAVAAIAPQANAPILTATTFAPVTCGIAKALKSHDPQSHKFRLSDKEQPARVFRSAESLKRRAASPSSLGRPPRPVASKSPRRFWPKACSGGRSRLTVPSYGLALACAQQSVARLGQPAPPGRIVTYCSMAVPISQRFAERMRAPTRNWVRLAWTAPQNTPSARTVSET